MLFEVLSTTSMLGVVLSTYYFRGHENDHEKIIKIAKEAGLVTKDGQLRIYRRSRDKNKQITDYVYRMPLGLSLKQFEEKKHLFEDGLNNKSRQTLHVPKVREIKAIHWKNSPIDVVKELRRLVLPRMKLSKELELSYDGMLKFRVYEQALAKYVPYDDAMLAKSHQWTIPIGKTRDEFIWHDFEKMQMMVVAGMTRYGKTVMLKNIITTLIHNEPDNVRFTLIDLKGGLAFNRFARCKQVITVAKDADETEKALETIHRGMLRQQKEFLEKGYEDIGEAGYSKRHFVIIDEGAEIAGFTDRKQRERCTQLVGEIARLGAGLSYRMVFATQYPTVDVFPRAVKSNTSATLSFRLKTLAQSMVVLDQLGAESLPVGLRGRAIYQTDQSRQVQTPYIPNDFIDEIIKIHIQAKPEPRDDDQGVKNHEQQDRKPTGSSFSDFEEV